MKGKSEIAAILNKYKDTLDNRIDSPDTKFLDWSDSPYRPGLIDKRSRNVPGSKSGSLTLSEEYCLDKNVLVTLLEPTLKIRAF